MHHCKCLLLNDCIQSLNHSSITNQQIHYESKYIYWLLNAIPSHVQLQPLLVSSGTADEILTVKDFSIFQFQLSQGIHTQCMEISAPCSVHHLVQLSHSLSTRLSAEARLYLSMSSASHKTNAYKINKLLIQQLNKTSNKKLSYRKKQGIKLSAVHFFVAQLLSITKIIETYVHLMSNSWFL